MIRCQAPKDNFDKYAADFDKILKAIKPPGEPQEPVVVPLEPTTYRPRK
jgi:hypothetical protein